MCLFELQQVGNLGALAGLGGLGNLGNLASLGNLGGLANLGNLGNAQAAQAAQAQLAMAFQQQLLRGMCISIQFELSCVFFCSSSFEFVMQSVVLFAHSVLYQMCCAHIR